MNKRQLTAGEYFGFFIDHAYSFFFEVGDDPFNVIHLYA